MAADILGQSFETAEGSWDQLTSFRKEWRKREEVVFRGHADSDWQLVPTVLRAESAALFEKLARRPLKCVDQIFMEFQTLEHFVLGCDSASVAVPNDSVEFREQYLTKTSLAE